MMHLSARLATLLHPPGSVQYIRHARPIAFRSTIRELNLLLQLPAPETATIFFRSSPPAQSNGYARQTATAANMLEPHFFLLISETLHHRKRQVRRVTHSGNDNASSIYKDYHYCNDESLQTMGKATRSPSACFKQFYAELRTLTPITMMAVHEVKVTQAITHGMNGLREVSDRSMVVSKGVKEEAVEKVDEKPARRRMLGIDCNGELSVMQWVRLDRTARKALNTGNVYIIVKDISKDDCNIACRRNALECRVSPSRRDPFKMVGFREGCAASYLSKVLVAFPSHHAIGQPHYVFQKIYHFSNSFTPIAFATAFSFRIYTNRGYSRVVFASALPMDIASMRLSSPIPRFVQSIWTLSNLGHRITAT
ncbi:uncharacterized protein BDR25DRAFT_358743 [Lindgomyces ingoldianus]|uniref:Uncharacterized protein n=1 Tax=Lindgomyces ingoldianus TaxID=673940 RepID=A0ACB6QM54_9PLEO|nr:uncharacterized protein BDR25DRAFT_358743 [Lindgomyces ingoldianus]KAF2467195.1 hypothetical protein BDR25DRAFT_358743 [Lindgomyces ingoldianus]